MPNYPIFQHSKIVTNFAINYNEKFFSYNIPVFSLFLVHLYTKCVVQLLCTLQTFIIYHLKLFRKYKFVQRTLQSHVFK